MKHMTICKKPYDIATRIRRTNGSIAGTMVRLSDDDCRTWPISRTVCEGPAGYSSLAVTPDGTVLCAYETLNETRYTGNIMLARFNLEWLLGKQSDYYQTRVL